MNVIISLNEQINQPKGATMKIINFFIVVLFLFSTALWSNVRTSIGEIQLEGDIALVAVDAVNDEVVYQNFTGDGIKFDATLDGINSEPLGTFAGLVSTLNASGVATSVNFTDGHLHRYHLYL